MAQFAETLVGRTAEVNVLERALAGVEQQRGCVAIELAGEPGIGKSPAR